MRAAVVAIVFALLAVSCASPPRPRPAPALFHPDEASVRSALNVGAGARPDQRAMNQAAQAIWTLCAGKHAVKDALDLVFDRNHDGVIDENELRSARAYFYGTALFNLNIVDAALAARLAAPPRTVLTQDDLRLWNEYLFVQPQRLLKPHPISNNFERKLAGNDAGIFTEKAIHDAVALVSRGAAESFFRATPAGTQAAPNEKTPLVAPGPVKTELQEYANTSGSGVVSEEEARAAEEALKSPHAAASAFDRAIDFDGTGYITLADIEEARRAAFIPAPKVASQALGPFPVLTRDDAVLDLNNDGVVTDDELATVARALAFGGGAPEVPAKLLALFDANGDGRLDGQELQVAAQFFRPHPVNPANANDIALDTRHAGYLTPDEIGIGAGKSAKGPEPTMDERVQALRLAARKQAASAVGTPLPVAVPQAQQKPEVATQKRVNLSGKKLAVMGITSATKNVDQESLDGATTFLENAFVNIGSAAIVDRSDIDKVMKELVLQSSSAFASDDSTAVKVGQLSGADVIVTGTISLVGKKYYLNVKLISVETGEVLGSSIASADGEDGFLTMCQQAVARLF